MGPSLEKKGNYTEIRWTKLQGRWGTDSQIANHESISRRRWGRSRRAWKNYDVDNIPKHFCDVLKEFTSDDERGDRFIETLIVEKRLLDNLKIPTSFCEEFLVFIADAKYKEHFIK